MSQVKTLGVVLNNMRYKETSIITHIFTKELGIRSYIVNSVHKNRAKHAAGLFQPLTMLDLVVYDKNPNGLNRISETKVYYPYTTLHSDLKKTTLALFLSEVLSKTLKEEDQNLELFNFLEESFIGLDRLESGVENFHVYFLFRLTNALGISPGDIYNFDALCKERGLQKSLLSDECVVLEQFFQDTTNGLNRPLRVKFLEMLLQYYQSYLSNFTEVKSLKILSEVFS